MERMERMARMARMERMAGDSSVLAGDAGSDAGKFDAGKPVSFLDGFFWPRSSSQFAWLC